MDDLIENYQNQVKEILKVGDLYISQSFNKDNLTKYADIFPGGTPSRSKSKFWNGNIKWINSGALTDQPVVTNTTECITELGVLKSSTKKANKGYTVLSRIEPKINKVSVILDDSTYFNEAVFCVRAKNTSHYGLIFFASRKLIDEIKGYASGSAQQLLNKQMLEGGKIYIPKTRKIQQLNMLLNKLLKLEEKIRILKQIKQQLLNKYF